MAIIAAVDGGNGSTRVASTAHELAAGLGTGLVVVHVVTEAEAEDRMDRQTDYYLDDAVADAERVAERIAGDVVEGGFSVEAVGKLGEPTEKILEVAEAHDADYVVIGGRKRTPIGKALLGSVTQSVHLSSDRPVVTVMEPEPED
ncbi:universal stress protein [Natrarchaeobaculum aegyptiacum]|uniref:UspA domain-containing protein n=1 Tax=Natrarchaeobaculum aegyptiacum TaxID=745377 RepID=A0A2Z2HXS9_9EURY|nr:universal stress protein [Natrarchaeobaculum aegyptiacum]ARS91075.1 hypothetical protein B1756_15935 [Natrarchaeobaculum aegyptiacum]